MQIISSSGNHVITDLNFQKPKSWEITVDPTYGICVNSNIFKTYFLKLRSTNLKASTISSEWYSLFQVNHIVVLHETERLFYSLTETQSMLSWQNILRTDD